MVSIRVDQIAEFFKVLHIKYTPGWPNFFAYNLETFLKS